MDPIRQHKPLLPGRGGLLVADFCLNTGMDRRSVEGLVRSGRVQGALTTDPTPMRSGVIYLDALPSRDELVAMGLTVRDGYDPSALRYGGIECRTHGWAQSVLITAYDAARRREVDRVMCWECSRAGLPADADNSTLEEPDA